MGVVFIMYGLLAYLLAIRPAWRARKLARESKRLADDVEAWLFRVTPYNRRQDDCK